MKKLISVLVILSVSNFAFGQSTNLDATAVSLADVLVKPEVRECIDTTLLANDVTNSSDGSFGVKEVETYTSQEPLFLNSAQMQSVTHYILKTRASSKPKAGPSKRIGIVFDIKIASGTGVLSYDCSASITLLSEV